MVRVVGDSIQEENWANNKNHLLALLGGLVFYLTGWLILWWDRRKEVEAKRILMEG